MPPVIPPTGDASTSPHKPRLVLYAQTYHSPAGEPISLLPLQKSGITHLILAAVHLNHSPTPHLTLNDDAPSAAKFTQLWSEVSTLQTSIPVLAMLGGAAKGSYALLSSSWETYYPLLRTFLRTHKLNGIDLDVEEPCSLYLMTKLIDALRSDFGPSFIITLAPVLTALIAGQRHLSGFNYRILEAMRGREIAWYNTQLYNGWGSASGPEHYQLAISGGWDPRRIVLGQLTSPENGHGYVELDKLSSTVAALRTWCAGFPGIEGEGFGGVMGWEYFNSSPGGREAPWIWAETVGEWLALPLQRAEGEVEIPGEPKVQKGWGEALISALTGLGFTREQAVTGLEIASGDVERAAGWLFEQ